MFQPAWNRVPVEIWNRVLLEAVLLDENKSPFLSATCTSSNYLAFKRTCGDRRSAAYRHEYKSIENHRRKLRLVCRAWKEFADRWDLCDRWVTVRSLKNEIPDETWRGALRVEYLDVSETWEHSIKSSIFCWKTLGGNGLRMTRLELLRLSKGEFKPILEVLFGAAKALPQLRSLGLGVPDSYGGLPRKLSRFFPRLTHLTLDFTIVGPGEIVWDPPKGKEIPEGAVAEANTLQLLDLEVLFLLRKEFLPDLDHWHLPRLKHFHAHPIGILPVWTDTIYPFLLQHSATIETLDLDNTTIGATGGLNRSDGQYIVEPGFWDMFPSLQLIRYSSMNMKFSDYPRNDHPLRIVVETDPIDLDHELIQALKPWVQGAHVKHPENIVVYGSYLVKSQHLVNRGEVQHLLKLMTWNATRLTNPWGKLWVNVL
ncbi:hypothetical protein FRB91_001741 [Serendipita sp. 411]|nr:hypothetical protein FRB91_001741 [Serendipita sp. 411]